MTNVADNPLYDKLRDALRDKLGERVKLEPMDQHLLACELLDVVWPEIEKQVQQAAMFLGSQGALHQANTELIAALQLLVKHGIDPAEREELRGIEFDRG